MTASRNRVLRRILLLVFALGWLPCGIVVQGIVRFGILPPDPGRWISLIPAAAAGVSLALASGLLWRFGHKRRAVTWFVILAVVTIPVTTMAGLLGAGAILLAGGLVSLPAWIDVVRAARNRRR